jgi:hypothetical protein
MPSCEPRLMEPAGERCTQLCGTWKVFKECSEGGMGGYSSGQCMLHDSATTTCSETLITYITVTVPAPDVQNSMAIVS